MENKYINPIKNKVAIEKVPVGVGGKLHFISTNHEKTLKWTIIATGPTCEEVKNGDTVIISNYAMATQLQQINDKYIVIPETEVIAKVVEL